MIRQLISKLQRVAQSTNRSALSGDLIAAIAKTEEMRAVCDEVRRRDPESLALKGFKVYSQNDEDGIIAAIFEAIGGGSTFLEIGVEDGRECNTHFLALRGWRGAWVEANTASVKAIEHGLGGRSFSNRFKIIEGFARADNIADLYNDVCQFTGSETIDFLSLDIDGNDLFVIEALLASGARPTVVCVEYNGRFPPPMCISVVKDEDRSWAEDDYFGASLQSFHDVLVQSGYTLVCCNVSGTNAFFVMNQRLATLKSYDPIEAWQPLRNHLTVLPAAHPSSLKFLRDALRVGFDHVEPTPSS